MPAMHDPYPEQSFIQRGAWMLQSSPWNPGKQSQYRLPPSAVAETHMPLDQQPWLSHADGARSGLMGLSTNVRSRCHPSFGAYSFG